MSAIADALAEREYPYYDAEDEIVISRALRQVHVTFEALAVVVAAPFMFYLATRKELPDWARVVSGTIGVATVIVDGGLLVSYLRKRQAK